MGRDSSLGSDPLRRRLRRLTKGQKREEAHSFIEAFYREIGGGAKERQTRLREIRRAISSTGSYEHTPEELAYGARVAWRNSSKCIGRAVWKSLDVIDCRTVDEPNQIAARLVEHLRLSMSDTGKVRSLISIFAPAVEGKPAHHVENGQLVQYAGYVDAEGVIGDPLNIEITRIALSLGWRPPGDPGPFDVLPLILRDRHGRRLVYSLPPDCHREVEIKHPVYPGLGALGLRWYAVPAVSDMILTIGGVDYPCAPFNGHYMCTEIASRDLTDEIRYNLLETIAKALEIDRGDVMWKDTTLLELNRSVLHSFQEAGVSIVDHHSASEQYLSFVQTERSAARIPSGNWAWIVPPQASSACPVFHLPMVDMADVPAFYRSRAVDGGSLGVSRATELRGPIRQRLSRLKRRLRRWYHGRD